MEKDNNKIDKPSNSVVIKSYFLYFGIILITIVIGAFVNCCLKWTINTNISTMLSALFYSGGTLGYLVTWRVQTFCGKTLPEEINKYFLIGSYVFGTLFLILGMTLKPIE